MSRIESTLTKILWGGLFLSFGYSFIILATLRYNGDPNERTAAIFPTPSYRCGRAPEFYPFFIATAFFIYIVCPISLGLTWNVRDSYGIRNSLWASVLIGFPCYVLYFIWVILLDRQYAEYWTSEAWVCIAGIAVHLSSVVLPICYPPRGWRTQLQAPDVVQFEKVLSNPALFARFCRYCAEEFCAEHTRFVEDYQALKVMAIEAFKDQFPEQDQFLDQDLSQPASIYYASPSNRNLLEPASPLPLIKMRSSVTTDVYSVPPPTISISGSINRFFFLSNEEPESEAETTGIVQASIPKSVHPPPTPTRAADLPVPDALKPSFCTFFNTFIESGATLQANLNEDIVISIRRKMELDQYSLDMFEDAKREVLELLQFNPFVRFHTLLEHEKVISRGSSEDYNERGKRQSIIYLEAV
ncbi:hypothetical protein BC937DRAFT_88046 [Endogone sp. FLAS-F59071]|nr:hypothetical protein BC937DRAFT_88046 [Endogone sp. FLAS-F59071]|eukprot:RUS19038.1 hypothetical protein BC937DRAFT_88046 [Endogone sp. FLAS-F59071]